MKRLALFIIISLSIFATASAQSDATKADSAYNKENYQLAEELYKKALSEGGPNAEIYYNLGNTEYRRGHIGQAILAYERCLKIDPQNADAKANLSFLNSKLEDKPEDNRSFLTRAHRAVVSVLAANTLAWLSIIIFACLAVAVCMYLFGQNVRIRKAGFFGAIVLAIISLYAIIVAYEAAARYNDHSEAIVTVPSTLLNSQPRAPKQTETVVPVHEGTKVEIVDSVDTPDDPESAQWYSVKINGSTTAWLRATDVERI